MNLVHERELMQHYIHSNGSGEQSRILLQDVFLRLLTIRVTARATTTTTRIIMIIR